MTDCTILHVDTLLLRSIVRVDGWKLSVSGGPGPAQRPLGAHDLTGKLAALGGVKVWFRTAAPQRPAIGAGFLPEIGDEVILCTSGPAALAFDLAFNAADASWIADAPQAKPGVGLKFSATRLTVTARGHQALTLDALGYPVKPAKGAIGDGAVLARLF